MTAQQEQARRSGVVAVMAALVGALTTMTVFSLALASQVPTKAEVRAIAEKVDKVQDDVAQVRVDVARLEERSRIVP